MEKLAKKSQKTLTFKAFSCIIKVSIKDRKVDIMATIDRFATDTIRKSNPHLSQLKATIEPAFYSNNATEIPTLAEAYELTSHAPNTTAVRCVRCKRKRI